MDNFSAFLSFMAFVLLLKQILIVDGISDTTTDDGFIGILGAIVDNSSRIGKEESIAMQIAVEDFINTSNQRLDLKIRNSQGDPLQAALAGGKLHSNLSRMTMVVWLFMALIITQTYTANLASMLTVQQLEPTITDVDALRQSNAMVGYCKGSFVSAYLKEVLGIHNIKQFDSIEEYAEALKSEVIAAAFLEAPLAKIFLRKYCKVFMEAGPTFKVGGFGFVFPRGSPLVPEVTEAMLKVTESGKLRDLENNMLASLKCLDSDARKDSGDPSLSPNSFWVLFVFTGGTSTTALVVYTFFIHKSVAESKTNWTIMLAAMKKWGNPNRRFSRRDSDINAESPAVAPNASALQA